MRFKVKDMALSASMLIFAAVIFGPEPAMARKVGYRLSASRNTAKNNKESTETASGSFMVASQCEDCNNGYRLDQVVFAGFDKTLNSGVESFFITNNTDRTLTGTTLYIEYLTPDGRQLNKRFIKLSCDIPPGETRKTDIRTWDTQHSFYYMHSRVPKSGGAPFDVRFDPIAFYLRF